MSGRLPTWLADWLGLSPGTNSDAVSWQLDENSGRIYYHRRYYSAPPGSGGSVIVADSVFRIPAGGGTAEVVWGRAPVPVNQFEINLGQGMGGFGVGGGRLFVSVWDRRQPPAGGGQTPPPETRSRILEIVESFARGLIARVDDPAVRRKQGGGTQVTVAVPPVTRAGRRTTGAEDAG